MLGQSNPIHVKTDPRRHRAARRHKWHTKHPRPRDPENCTACSGDGAEKQREDEAGEKPPSKVKAHGLPAPPQGQLAHSRAKEPPPERNLRSASRATVSAEVGRLNCSSWRFVRIRFHGVLRIPAAFNTPAGGPCPGRGLGGPGFAGSLRRRSGCSHRRLPWWRCLRRTDCWGSVGRRPGCCPCRG